MYDPQPLPCTYGVVTSHEHLCTLVMASHNLYLYFES